LRPLVTEFEPVHHAVSKILDDESTF